jgi:beta-lactam-binding protein with PASTA domain
MSLAQAQGRLHKADLSYRIVKQYSWKPAGQVITQKVAAGSKVRPGRVITLVVARAMPRVPHVAGQSVKAGTSVLKGAGFTVSVVHEVVTSGASGVILRTTPVAGTQKSPGSPITVVVSNLVRPVAPPPPPPAASNCTPGYKPCLPPAYDYDCAGGSGDGPKYANGPIYVSGSDPYGLDADGDGVACEW